MNKLNLIDKEIDDERKAMLAETYRTALTKVNFINELKAGLGEEIKKNPNKVRIIKRTRFERFILSLKKIFSRI